MYLKEFYEIEMKSILEDEYYESHSIPNKMTDFSLYEKNIKGETLYDKMIRFIDSIGEEFSMLERDAISREISCTTNLTICVRGLEVVFMSSFDKDIYTNIFNNLFRHFEFKEMYVNHGDYLMNNIGISYEIHFE